jgi:hypothetical protein
LILTGIRLKWSIKANDDCAGVFIPTLRRLNERLSLLATV